MTLLERFIHRAPLAEILPVAEADQISEAAQLCTGCRVSQDVMRYMAKICEAARNPDKVRLGPSPRALLALMRCCQALAAIRGRDYVIPDDVKELAVPVLAHRILMRGINFQTDSAKFLQDLLQQVPAPTEEAV